MFFAEEQRLINTPRNLLHVFQRSTLYGGESTWEFQRGRITRGCRRAWSLTGYLPCVMWQFLQHQQMFQHHFFAVLWVVPWNRVFSWKWNSATARFIRLKWVSQTNLFCCSLCLLAYFTSKRRSLHFRCPFPNFTNFATMFLQCWKKWKTWKSEVYWRFKIELWSNSNFFWNSLPACAVELNLCRDETELCTFVKEIQQSCCTNLQNPPLAGKPTDKPKDRQIIVVISQTHWLVSQERLSPRAGTSVFIDLFPITPSGEWWF